MWGGKLPGTGRCLHGGFCYPRSRLKLVFPQEGAEPHLFEDLYFRRFYLQPMDGSERARNTELSLRYCLEHPQWRLSLQTHKILAIP